MNYETNFKIRLDKSSGMFRLTMSVRRRSPVCSNGLPKEKGAAPCATPYRIIRILSCCYRMSHTNTITNPNRNTYFFGSFSFANFMDAS
jgi:hypothetical protein